MGNSRSGESAVADEQRSGRTSAPKEVVPSSETRDMAGASIFLAHAESEKPFVEKVKDRIVALSRSRRTRSVGLAKGVPPRARPRVYYDKDSFSPTRGQPLGEFTSHASASDALVLFVPDGGFRPRSIVGKELLAFMTGIVHSARDEPDPERLTEGQVSRAHARMQKVLLVDRWGTLTWEDGGVPSMLPSICRDGILQQFFRTERPRMREQSSRADDVAAAALAHVWNIAPEKVRSRVAARQRLITTLVGFAAAAMAAVAVFALVERSKAEHERNVARNETSRALAALDTATKQACSSMSAQARALLAGRPAWAVRLGWDAVDICTSYSGVAVERDALEQDPTWAMLPPHPAPAGVPFADLWTARSDAPFAMDPGLRRAVTTASEIGSNHPTPPVVWNVDNEKKLGPLPLEPKEHLAASVDPASQVFATRNGKVIRLWDWGSIGMPYPAHRDNHAVAWSCASGTWPCAVLRDDGQVLLLGGPTAAPRTLGRWLGATDLSLSRTGRAMAVVLPDHLQWTQVGSGDAGEQTLPTVGHHIRPPTLTWGPGDRDLVIVEDNESTPSGITLQLLAWKVGTGVATVASTRDDSRPLAPAVEGSRVAWFCASDKPDKGNRMCVYDLAWGADGAPGVKSHALDEGKQAASSRDVAEAALSPSGGYLLLAVSTSGSSGATTSVSSIETWDLWPLDRDTDETPVPAHLSPHQDSPIARAVYSHDGKRIAVWQEDGTVEVWRVRVAKPPLLDQTLRVPEKLLERLQPVVRPIDVLSSRWIVRFARDDHEIVTPDAAAVRLEDRFPGESIFAAVPSAHKSVLVATSRRLVVLGSPAWHPGHVVRFAAPIKGACTTGTLLVVDDGSEATVFRTSDASRVAAVRFAGLPPGAVSELACEGEARHEPRTGLPSSLPVAEIPGGKLLVLYATPDGTIHGLVEAIVAGTATMVRKWSVKLDSHFERNFGVYVAPKRGRVFIGSFQGGFHVVNALTGVADPGFPQPSTGWPTSGPTAGWEDGRGVHLIFAGYPTKLWSSAGPPHPMITLPGDKLVEAWTGADGAFQLALQRDKDDGQPQRVVWDTRAAKAVWTGKVVSSDIPTPPEARGAKSPAGANRMVRRVLRGGRLDALTRVPLPREMADRLARLSHQLAALHAEP